MASRARTEGRRADGGAARTDGGARARGGRPRASISRARARARREEGGVPRRGVRKILAHRTRGAREAEGVGARVRARVRWRRQRPDGSDAETAVGRDQIRFWVIGISYTRIRVECPSIVYFE